MRIHLNERPYVLQTALDRARESGVVAESVGFTDYSLHGSRSHAGAVEVRLVSWQKLPGEKRRRPNSGQWGNTETVFWAATWHEWGWFFAHVFDLDPTAKAGPYDGVDEFHRLTDDQFHLDAEVAR